MERAIIILIIIIINPILVVTVGDEYFKFNCIKKNNNNYYHYWYRYQEMAHSYNCNFFFVTATIIQAQFRGYSQRKKYMRLRVAAIILETHWRRVVAQRLLKRRRNAAHRVRKYALNRLYCDLNISDSFLPCLYLW